MNIFKAKQKPWFKPVRDSYIPVSWEGLRIYLLYVLYIFALLINWFESGRDATALLTSVIPLMVAATILTQFIASKHSD